ncbi:MAG: RNA polymerase factor sigma-32 [Deltaproteobacteria bacterium]|nr:RNA polymerase factor sigma-32 [Deltaproteobacteria bacterium]
MSKHKSVPAVLDPLAQYANQIQQYPVLNKEEEFRLAVRYHKHKDLEAAHKLVVSNLRFVIKIANEYAHYGLKILDLIQEGNIGLMRAVKTYNPYKDTRLITYAVWWIRSYIHDYIQHNWSLVKIGTTQAQRKLFYKLQQEKDELSKLELEQTPKLLAHKLGVKEKEVIEMENRMRSRDVSLDTPISEDEKASHLEFVADQQNSAEQQLSDEEQKIIVQQKMEAFEKHLKGRDLYIYKNRLISENPMSLQEIGDHFQISKERARQLEERIKQKLKNFLSESDH